MQIPKAEIADKWEGISAWVKSSLGVDRAYSVDDVRLACESGDLILWIIYKDNNITGFLTTMLNQCPQGKTCYAPWLGGENLDQWVAEGFAQLKIWLKQQGCMQFSWIGRKAWQKLIKVDYEGCFYLINL